MFEKKTITLFLFVSILFLFPQLGNLVENPNILGETTSEPEYITDTNQVDAPVLKDLTLFEVASVIDGDTIKIIKDGSVKTVRIANINTPETVDPRKPVECLGKQASDQMKELVGNKKVRLLIDETQQSTDRYGRLLRFVFLEDGTDVGLQMITLGLAHSAPYGSTPHVFFTDYEAAQVTAKSSEIGLWNPNLCQ